MENGVNLLNKRIHCPEVEVSNSTQTAISSRNFAISSPDMYPHSRARFMCALVPPHLTSSCWGQTQELCMVSRSSKVPALVEGRPTVQCNRDLLLSLPESSLNHLSRYLEDLIFDIHSPQIQAYIPAGIVLDTRKTHLYYAIVVTKCM